MSGAASRPKGRRDTTAIRSHAILPGLAPWHMGRRPTTNRQYSRRVADIDHALVPCPACGEEVSEYRIEQGRCPECLPIGGAA